MLNNKGKVINTCCCYAINCTLKFLILIKPFKYPDAYLM